MPQLTWIGKDKVENHDKDLPFRVLKPNKKLSVGEDDNLLIQGDNLEALKSLMPFYYKKVKLIYIDPPYNTGKPDQAWYYNDRVNSPKIKAWLNQVVGPEGQDLCRHDKWLCMIYPRLKLLRELLAEDGVICISIDDIELANLLKVMDEIFGVENKEEVITWRRRHNQPNDKSKPIAKVAEFIVVYAKNLAYLKEVKKFNGVPLTGKFSNPDNDPKGDWASKPWKAGSGQSGSRYSITTPSGRILEEDWLGSEATFKDYLKEGRIYFPNSGKGSPRKKYYRFEREEEGQMANNFWNHTDFGSNQEATQELKKMGLNFNNPKPVRLISALISIFTDEGDLVVDSFAGSGTTGHAVLEFNKATNKKRKFILVELEEKIAKEITSERLKRVITGYEEAKFPKGTGQGFQYLDLNGELFNRSGFINDVVNYEDLASYIYFTETKSYLDLKTIEKPFIGTFGSNNYFLLFEGKGKNVLDEKALKQISKYSGKKVIFADKTLLDDDYCEKHNIVFKQIPYELKKY